MYTASTRRDAYENCNPSVTRTFGIRHEEHGGDDPGEQEALKAFDAYTTPECNVHDTLEAMLRQADGECVIVTDVLGGSVNKEAVVFAAQPGVRVITGMNLTLVATLLTEEELPLDELVKTSIAEAQASIQQPEFVSKEEDF